MLDVADVAPVATIAKPVPISPDKAALKYLEASGAAAISITTDVDGVEIKVGFKPGAAEVLWLWKGSPREIAAKARALVGNAGDVEAAVAALQEAAVRLRATLTKHNVAIARAGAAAQCLDQFMSSMHGTGVLREFNRTYKARRQAAFARGEGFMNYKIALARLRSAISRS
jgi:hypothetical protein